MNKMSFGVAAAVTSVCSASTVIAQDAEYPIKQLTGNNPVEQIQAGGPLINTAIGVGAAAAAALVAVAALSGGGGEQQSTPATTGQ